MRSEGPIRDVSSLSTAELVRDVADDVRMLVRKELELARVELTEAVADKAKGAGLIAGAAVASLPGLIFLVVALALWIPPSNEAGFAIVGSAMLVAAGIAVALGVRLVKKPSKGATGAVDSIKEDLRWARSRLRP